MPTRTRSRKVHGSIVLMWILVPPSKPAGVLIRHLTIARSGMRPRTSGPIVPFLVRRDGRAGRDVDRMQEVGPSVEFLGREFPRGGIHPLGPHLDAREEVTDPDEGQRTAGLGDLQAVLGNGLEDRVTEEIGIAGQPGDLLLAALPESIDADDLLVEVVEGRPAGRSQFWKAATLRMSGFISTSTRWPRR